MTPALLKIYLHSLIACLMLFLAPLNRAIGEEPNANQDIVSKNQNITTDNQMLTVKKISFPCKQPPVKLVEKMLDSLEIPYNDLNSLNWPSQYPYRPQVKFRIAYSTDEIYLQYIVQERYLRAVYDKDEGSMPYKDSCVEFFIIPSSVDSVYYNLELNCIAIGTFAGGAKRTERIRFDSSVMSKIRRYSTLGNSGFDTREGEFEWSLVVALPIELFSISEIEPLDGRTVKANFFKCGDDLPERHYLSWNPVGTERPNFHTPDYFGNLYFEPKMGN